MKIELREIDAYLKGMNSQNEACTEHLVKLMLSKGLATGHGDNFVDLLQELAWQIDELQAHHNRPIK